MSGLAESGRRGTSANGQKVRQQSAMRRTGCYGMSRAGLLRLDVRELDHPGPLLGFVGDELAEVRGRAGKHCTAQGGKSRLRPGLGEDRIDLLVEPLDDFGRRRLRRVDAEKCA